MIFSFKYTVATIFLLLFLFSVAVVDAQTQDPAQFFSNIGIKSSKELAKEQGKCGASSLSGDVKVNHSVCNNPPKTNGKTCTVGGTQGGKVKAACQEFCCKVKDFTKAPGADEGGFDPSSMMGGGMDKIMEMLQKLMGGGGGGGGGGEQPDEQCPDGYKKEGAQRYNYLNSEKDRESDVIWQGSTKCIKDVNLLKEDPNLLKNSINDESLGIFDTIFGDDTTTNSSDESEDGTVINDDTNRNTNNGGGSGNGESNPAQEGDTIETTYESLEAVANNPIIGDGVQSDTYIDANGDDVDLFAGVNGEDFYGDGGDFDNDFFGANLDASDGSVSGKGVSKEFLEAQGLLEALRQGATGETHSGSLEVPYESLTTAEIRTLQDYHSSAVSGGLSPFQGNPLSNEQYNSNNENAEQEQDGGFFRGVARFFGALFGITN